MVISLLVFRASKCEDMHCMQRSKKIYDENDGVQNAFFPNWRNTIQHSFYTLRCTWQKYLVKMAKRISSMKLVYRLRFIMQQNDKIIVIVRVMCMLCKKFTSRFRHFEIKRWLAFLITVILDGRWRSSTRNRVHKVSIYECCCYSENTSNYIQNKWYELEWSVTYLSYKIHIFAHYRSFSR